MLRLAWNFWKTRPKSREVAIIKVGFNKFKCFLILRSQQFTGPRLQSLNNEQAFDQGTCDNVRRWTMISYFSVSEALVALASNADILGT